MLTRPSTDRVVDAFVSRIDASIQPAAAAPWIEALEARLPHPFPPSFRSLVMRYTFPAFDLGPVRLFANTGDLSRDDELAVRVFVDRALSDVLLKHGYIQFGQGAGGSYDPVCFDTRKRRGGGECPIVRLDHEEALVRDEVRILEQVSGSFLELLQRIDIG